MTGTPPPPSDWPDPPDYGGAWVGAVVPALLGAADDALLPEPARHAEQVVLLVLDGLGWTALSAQATPTLSGLEGTAVDTTAPSTTATALTSITTGRPPGEHGVVGYRMRVAGRVLPVLRWKVDDGPDPEQVQPCPPFGGRPVPVVSRAEFRGSGFTAAHLRGGPYVGWKERSTLVEHTLRLVAAQHALVYAYYDGVDKVGHEYGPASSFFARELASADALVAELLDELPARCALVVTADHGMVDAPLPARVELDAVAGMVGAWSGEGRFRSLVAKPGQSRRLLGACREAYGEQAWVVGRDEIAARGWLGGAPTPTVLSRLGDVVLAARTDAAFLAPDAPKEASMLGMHGSLTPPELRVPLAAARGRGRAPARQRG